MHDIAVYELRDWMLTRGSRQVKKIDLDKLEPKARDRVERALNPRDKMLSLKFSDRDLKFWRLQASLEGRRITEWVESACNAYANREVKP